MELYGAELLETTKEDARDCAIDFLRVFACFLIVWNHTSGHILNGAWNRLSWANIGVQVFFFMSGYLYSDKSFTPAFVWLKKQSLKIIKPYWLYLVIILPVIWMLRPEYLTHLNVLASIACLQGFGERLSIVCLGQHWFISYILLCYVLTPWLPKLIQHIELGRGGINIRICV